MTFHEPYETRSGSARGVAYLPGHLALATAKVFCSPRTADHQTFCLAIFFAKAFNRGAAWAKNRLYASHSTVGCRKSSPRNSRSFWQPPWHSCRQGHPPQAGTLLFW